MVLLIMGSLEKMKSDNDLILIITGAFFLFLLVLPLVTVGIMGCLRNLKQKQSKKKINCCVYKSEQNKIYQYHLSECIILKE